MKMKNVLLFIILLIISSNSYATDQWRVFGAGFYDEKSKYDPPPFRKWHKTTIGYTISSAPSGLGYLIDRSFDTWEACGYLSFSSGSDITVQTVSGSNPWFGYGPSTCNLKGEIISAMIQLNDGTYPYGGEQKDIVWTDGNENVGGSGSTWYCDVQNCVTHELGHNLGIAHHSTGNGEPTMATRAQCPSFNTTLKRRTLETDDWEALDFLYQNAFVPSEYSTISSALNMINQIGEGKVTVSSGTYTENNSLTANSGITLQLNSGVTLKMASGKKLTINGTLSVQGTSGNRITFQSISGTWYGIEVNYGGYTPLNYCIIKNATCGIRAYQTSNLYVENCEITNNTNGITFANQSSGYVRYSKINSNLGNSGINCSQNSNPIIRSYNQLKNNAPAGLYGDYNSLPELGSWANYGNNSIANSYDDVWSENSNSVYALYNYWGSSSPNPGVSSNVVWQPYLTSDPTGGGLLKPLADNAPLVLDNTAADTTGKSEFARAYLVYLSGDYAAAMVLFKELVIKYPETAAGLQALALTDHCYQHLDNATASLSYLTQVSDSYAGKEISGLAQSIAVGHLVKLGSYQEAITKSEQILQTFPDKDLAKYALYDLGTIYWFFLADHKTGESYYRQLIAKYPDDDLSISALATLGEWQPGSQPKPEAPPPLTDEHAIPAAFRLDQNYPNPFNPETTIRYHLAEASAVTIKIYNLLGAEVITLVDQIQLQGDHAIQWNGRDRFGNAVANGVYWLRLQAGNFVAQRKLVVLR